MNPMNTIKNACVSLVLLLAVSGSAQTDQTAANHLRFQIKADAALIQHPVSGRLLVFMTTKAESLRTIEPDFLDPRSVWVAAIEIHNLAPGQTIDFDPEALSFPAPFSTAPSGDYQIMALLDLDHSYTYNGMGPGDLYSEVTMARNLNPASASSVQLTLARQAPERKLADTDAIKLVTFQSPSLTAFWGRPITMRAGVVLPPGYAKEKAQRYPTVYVVHGYGGSHATAWRRGPIQIKQMTDGKAPEMIYVYLNAVLSLGHHVFADSVNNGPWGHALTSEFIPYLEKQFRMDGTTSGRLLTGHSSGGWSTLWLQVNYPEVFGGTWSTSPDPVDFRNFTGPDLTSDQPQSLFHGADGKPYNLIRFRGREIMTIEDYVRLERVEGYYGGQMASFEAVFSPRGPDGKPMPLFDRDTGRIDPVVQKAWERYDISRIVRKNWTRLKPRLRGKLHLIVGTADTFHLEEAVYLFRDTLKSLSPESETSKVPPVEATQPAREVFKLPGGGYIEFVEGRDHFDLNNPGLDERIAREMYEVARPKTNQRARRKAV